MGKYDIHSLLKRQDDLNREMNERIKDVLRDEGRIDLLSDGDNRFDIDYPVSIMAYGSNDNFEIRITSVYLDGNSIYMDGLDSSDCETMGLKVFTQMSYDVLFFVNYVLRIKS